MRTVIRYIVVAALGGMALFGIFCSDWIDATLAECPTTWSGCERSFAYVTHVDTDYSTLADEGIGADHCDVVALLPLQRIDEKPSGDADRLLEGATRIDTREDDYDRVCTSWLHTWQAIVYDPRHRQHAQFTSLPKSSGLDLRKVLVMLVVALCVGYPIWRKYGGRIWGWISGAAERARGAAK